MIYLCLGSLQNSDSFVRGEGKKLAVFELLLLLNSLLIITVTDKMLAASNTSHTKSWSMIKG